ncbi:MAG: hypothetical protein LAT61_12645 [Alcanivorax sp.]|nr:hypothetical protein [Alcanivorax sp.]
MPPTAQGDTASAPLIAFPSSEPLHRHTDGFIRRMATDRARPEPDTLETIMETFIDESLGVFFLAPAKLVGLSPGMQRVIRVAADTIGKAGAMVIKRASRKLDLAQHRETAAYMEEMRIMVPDSDGNEVWYVAFPVEESLAQQLVRSRELAEHGDHQQAAKVLAEALHALTDVALHWYFERPVALLRFGPVMRKMADVALTTSRKATHGVIRKVFADMDAEQALTSAQYMSSMVLRP